MQRLDEIIQQLLRDGGVPGLSIALIRRGEIAELINAGTRNTSTRAPVEPNTIFDAASLSKPMFAHAVLQLIDAGALSLDAPLAKYVPDYVSDDPRAADVTVRNVLSHTTGLPNWRGNDYPLKTYFPPGARFNYSGEGFVWLQRVVEVISGKPVDSVMQRLIFDPLEMRDSGYVWRPQFDANHADPHDGALVPGTKAKPMAANTAYSLQTTASDYARFVQSVLSGARLKPAMARLWLDPHVRVGWHRSQCLAPTVLESDQQVAWALGWGLEPDHGTFFHWGDNGRFKSFAIGSVVSRSAAVVFANGENGMSIMAELIDRLMPGEHPGFRWLNYARYVSSGH